MKFVFSTLLIILGLSSTVLTAGMLTNSAEEIPIAEDNPKQEAEDITHCNNELLINYGLGGQHEPVITNHMFCPAISQNCCNNNDEAKSMQIWEADIKPVVER